MKQEYLQTGCQVLADESSAMQELQLGLAEEFNAACRLIDACRGRIVFIGMGHSGHVAAKSASSFSSLGIPSFFLHAAEAVHGELGLVTEEDVSVFISNSGETADILAILPRIIELGAGSIAIVGRPDSTLARNCDVTLYTGFKEEAAPLKFAGSSSALLSMALCDALGIAVAASRGLTEAQYLKHHPGGAVGKRLKEKLK
jgi:arabinose-5-phosphate isomerase